MKIRLALALAAMSLLAASCSENAPPAPQTPPPPSASALNAPALLTVAPGATAAPVNTAPPMPVPPPDAQWTICCQRFQGPAHVAEANRAKAEAARAVGGNGWYAIHAANDSTLYYGFYESYSDRSKTVEFMRAQADRRMLVAFATADGEHPFAECGFVNIPTPDPDANSAWNLINSKGYWSLQICAYQGSVDRKQFAVDTVKDMRAHGIEAYFYHGESISSVCVGSWPEDAVMKQQMDNAQVDDSRTLLVLPDVLPAGMKVNMTDPQGNPVTPVAPVVQVLNQDMLAMMKTYPVHHVNGYVQEKTGKNAKGEKVTEPVPSFLVIIPEARKAAAAGSSDPLTNTNQMISPEPTAVPDQPAAPSGVGRLRSIGG